MKVELQDYELFYRRLCDEFVLKEYGGQRPEGLRSNYSRRIWRKRGVQKKYLVLERFGGSKTENEEYFYRAIGQIKKNSYFDLDDTAMLKALLYLGYELPGETLAKALDKDKAETLWKLFIQDLNDQNVSKTESLEIDSALDVLSNNSIPKHFLDDYLNPEYIRDNSGKSATAKPYPIVFRQDNYLYPKFMFLEYRDVVREIDKGRHWGVTECIIDPRIEKPYSLISEFYSSITAREFKTAWELLAPSGQNSFNWFGDYEKFKSYYLDELIEFKWKSDDIFEFSLFSSSLCECQVAYTREVIFTASELSQLPDLGIDNIELFTRLIQNYVKSISDYCDHDQIAKLKFSDLFKDDATSVVFEKCKSDWSYNVSQIYNSVIQKVVRETELCVCGKEFDDWKIINIRSSFKEPKAEETNPNMKIPDIPDELKI
ncbi:hypothetical protein Q4E93_09950 [Flavitalea sp. BT771]|uniref:hypothetical protein n=1 Tax=Flavitalea sp. BT771 TaxID=3063329 RepID=UPI0026E2B637|nr:hypothetical protein [Flavitalea sp. BT771]MDO6430910.1 hypothetical protein [Flavitalea sp. BT771]MDV6218950.1 hypothetical protein [Flavitalea sp. BT771]